MWYLSTDRKVIAERVILWIFISSQSGLDFLWYKQALKLVKWYILAIVFAWPLRFKFTYSLQKSSVSLFCFCVFFKRLKYEFWMDYILWRNDNIHQHIFYTIWSWQWLVNVIFLLLCKHTWISLLHASGIRFASYFW